MVTTKKRSKRFLVDLAVAALLYAVIAYLMASGRLTRQYQGLLVPIGINIILAVSLSLTVGFLGELNLGHAGFMSVGAYAGCYFATTIGASLPTLGRLGLAMLIGGLVAALLGFIVGVPALRLRGDYLAIVTLAFGEIVRSVLTNTPAVGGAGGLKHIGKDSNFHIVFIVAVITVLVISNLVNSRHGRAICAIRDNVIAAESVGINVVYYKILAFVLSAFFAGVAGVLYGHNLGILKPDTFDFNKSIEILVFVVMGGMYSIRGSIIAATLVTLLPEVLRGLADYRTLIYAIVLILMMIANASPRFQMLRERISLKNILPKTRKEDV